MRAGLLLLLALASGSAWAATCQQEYQHPSAPSSAGPFATSHEAMQVCTSKLGMTRVEAGSNYSKVRNFTQCYLDTTMKRFQLRSYYYNHLGENGSGQCVAATGSPNTAQYTGANYTYTTLNTGPTTEECLALNENEQRDKITTSDAPQDYCNGVCMMAVDDTPHKSTSGVGPDGQPVTWYHYGQSYSGAACADMVSPPTDPDPLAPDLPDTPAADGWSCNQAMGTCADPDGDMHYCTFTPQGARSACVPMAEDSDGDGVHDDADTSPDDPDNGQDNGTGNESDNVSTGGGNCSNPPRSSGDAIAAQIAYQTWATRCAVDKLREASGSSGSGNTGTPGTPGGSDCAVALSCTGMSSADCFALGVAKRDACASESLAGTLSEIQGDGVNGDCAPGDTACTGLGTEGLVGGLDGTASAGEGAGGPGEGGFDDAGFLSGNRECPAPVSVSVMGIELDLNRDTFCDFMGIGAMLVMLAAGLLCARIVGGAI